MKGWIKLHRESAENFLYKENRPHTKREAWEDILLYVNHKDSDVLIGNKVYTCKRGESLMSLGSWAAHFKWTRWRVKRFFDLLASEHMIELKCDTKTTHLTVCNYEYYQDDRTSNAHQTHIERTSNAHQTHTNKNVKNEKNKKNKNILSEFEVFRKMYPGVKRGHEVEFENFKKKHKDWEDVVRKLPEIIEAQISLRQQKERSGQFVPQWKNLSTWINGRCWEEEEGSAPHKPKPAIDRQNDPNVPKIIDFKNKSKNEDSNYF